LRYRYYHTTNSAFKLLAAVACFHLIEVCLANGKVEVAKRWMEKLKKEILTLYGTLDMAKFMDKRILDLMGQHNIFLE